jgi:hypothetical protein
MTQLKEWNIIANMILSTHPAINHSGRLVTPKT